MGIRRLRTQATAGDRAIDREGDEENRDGRTMTLLSKRGNC